MYAYIKGNLISASPIYAIVDVHGIGYQIHIPANVFAKLPQVGAEVTLYTSYIVRELSQTLYGFLTIPDKDVFELLMSVTGIGPKIALSLIGHLSIQDLQRAISNHDLPTICRVPGIGKKTAERLIIELRDKLHASAETPSDPAFAVPGDPRAQMIRDAMGALINLGYNQMIAQTAIKKTLKSAPEDIDLGALITHSLKHL